MTKKIMSAQNYFNFAPTLHQNGVYQPVISNKKNFLIIFWQPKLYSQKEGAIAQLSTQPRRHW